MKEDAANGEARKGRHVLIVKPVRTAIHWTMVSIDTKVCAAYWRLNGVNLWRSKLIAPSAM